jgi:transposase
MKGRAKMIVVETTSEGATSVGKSIIDLSSVTAVGLDLAKHVFQVHCVDASGCVVVAKAIRRNKLLEFFASLPPCLVGLEASGSAHHWARELIKLGHDARMMPPAYVKPYIRRQKNDAADAAAICEAVTRPSMRFVGVRSLENQAGLMRHKAREMLVSQRTQLLNGLRGHLTEVGVIAAQGPRHARELAELIEACDETVPFEVCEALAALVVQLRNLDEAIARLDRTIAKLAQKDETARRLMSIPGFGPITASAMAATIQDTSSFAGPREFAAFLGLTPKQNSSGGKPKLGRISKMGTGLALDEPSEGTDPRVQVTTTGSQVVEATADVPAAAPSLSAPRGGTKLARVLELLQRDCGATLEELIAATDWLPHTTRAALTGLRKRGYAVTINRSDKERGSAYRARLGETIDIGGAAAQSDYPPTISTTRKLKKAQRSEKPRAQQAA